MQEENKVEVVTEEVLKKNPELKEMGVKVGEEIETLTDPEEIAQAQAAAEELEAKKKAAEEEAKRLEAEAKAEAERQFALEEEKRKTTVPGVPAGSAPTSSVGLNNTTDQKEVADRNKAFQEKLLNDAKAIVPTPARPIYVKSTLSGKECIPCAFVFGTEILTPEEARQLHPDVIPADYII